MNELIPSESDMKSLEIICGRAVKSKYLPRSIETPEQAFIIALKGRELGIPPMQAFSQISVINGKPCISSELMLALIYKNIPGVSIQFLESSDKSCVIKIQRPGNEPSIFTFTIDDAKRADLLGKDPWKKYPVAMLRARCISAMARATAPDALMGASYTPEELDAPSPDKDPTPQYVEADVIDPVKPTPEKKSQLSIVKESVLTSDVMGAHVISEGKLIDRVVSSLSMDEAQTYCTIYRAHLSKGKPLSASSLDDFTKVKGYFGFDI